MPLTKSRREFFPSLFETPFEVLETFERIDGFVIPPANKETYSVRCKPKIARTSPLLFFRTVYEMFFHVREKSFGKLSGNEGCSALSAV